MSPINPIHYMSSKTDSLLGLQSVLLGPQIFLEHFSLKIKKLGLTCTTLLYLKRITNGDLLYSTGNSAQCYVAAWMGGESRGEWIHGYVWLSRFAVHLKPSQRC